jgi:hypothetical protein
MGKRPAFFFYSGDWMKDPCLSMCSPTTRGIWVDLMCAIHENNDGGKITGSYNQLARICRCSPAEIEEAVNEIKETKTGNVTFCNGNVTIINRRMKREHDEREATKIRVKRYRSKKQDPPQEQMKQECNNASSYTSTYSITKEEVFIELPIKDGDPFPITNDAIKENEILYSHIDVRQEFKKMKGWLLADTKRLKTGRGIKRFYNGWLSRANDGMKEKKEVRSQGESKRKDTTLFRP